MKKMTKLFPYLPESYLLFLILAAGFNPPFSFSPLALIFAAIIGLQLFFRNAITGIMLSNLFILINLYGVLALLSEFSEFPAFNFGAARLLIVGAAIILANLFIGGYMFYIYFKKV